MISTKTYQLLPDKTALQNVCKALAVLDAILSPEWEYRYYSYNATWSKKEECFEMRDGQGDQMLILFRDEGCIINGFAHECKQPDKTELTKGLPAIFKTFMFGETVKAIGTTFCLWLLDSESWQMGEVKHHDNGSEEMLAIFDGKAQRYVDWATEYFEGSYKEKGIPLATVKQIYAGKPLARKMVLTMVDDVDDWKGLERDLKEIGYPYDFR
jgi:hypothetical protein